MKQFFDTSVLVAAFWRGQVHHLAGVKRLAGADKKDSACSIHSLAEVYAAMKRSLTAHLVNRFGQASTCK
jgi:hypothetical protein